jgi:hypothetical protein
MFRLTPFFGRDAEHSALPVSEKEPSDRGKPGYSGTAPLDLDLLAIKRWRR